MPSQTEQNFQQNPAVRRKKILKRIKSFFDIFRHRSFYIFLVLALLLWYFNRLGHRFTTEIEVPVKISTNYDSDVWIEQSNLMVKFLVEGEGRRLVLYKLGMAPKLEIPASELVFLKDSTKEYPYRHSIRPSSMLRALALGIKDINFQQSTDSAILVNVSPMKQAKLPIHNNIRIDPARQYMQVGSTVLSPDSADIKAPVIILDTLRWIETQSRHYKDSRYPLNGNVGLKLPRGVVSNISSVKYSADITSYTEVEYELHIQLISPPANFRPIAIPATVDLLLRMPLRSYEANQNKSPIAEIDLAGEHSTSLHAVKINSLPAGSEIISTQPEFVEVFLEPINQ